MNGEYLGSWVGRLAGLVERGYELFPIVRTVEIDGILCTWRNRLFGPRERGQAN